MSNPPDLRFRNYFLGLLTLILAFNYVDRLALGVVLESIKADLALTDTQLGFLTGVAFALFYSLMGIPIARWADRGNRVTIITVTIGLWSVAVAICGAVTSYTQLLLIRVGVAVGEAGCIPPAHSLIADYFDRAERPRAISVYSQGTQLAMVIGYFAAGWLNQLYGWRMTFVAISIPGLFLALLSHFTLKEPRHLPSSLFANALKKTSQAQESLATVLKVLWEIRTFRHLLVCFSVWYFFGYGLLQWQPVFLIRSHGFRTGELGAWLAGIHGLIGGVGVYLGGAWASKYAAGNERLQLKVCAGAFVFFALANACAYLAADRYATLALLALASLGGNMAQGPMLATILTLVPARMRAISIAVVYLFANLIGMGLGPLAGGVLSDALRPTFGEQSLRYALIFLCPGYIWAAWHIWRASFTAASDIAGAKEGVLGLEPTSAAEVNC